MKRLFYIVVFLIIFVVGLTFAARNPQEVGISYYFGIDVQLPLTAMLLATLVVGIVIGYLMALTGGYQRYRRRQRARADTAPGTSMASRSG